MRRGFGGDDGGDQPEPRGPTPGDRPGHAAAGALQPDARLRDRGRVHGGVPARRRGRPQTRSCWSSKARSRTSSINGDGHWAGLGVDPETGQPITTTSWIDRLAPRAAAVLALGTCAAYGGIPAMRGNPTGAMGLRDYLGPAWSSRLGARSSTSPVAPSSPTTSPRRCCTWRCTWPASSRCSSSMSRAVRGGCSSAPFRRAADAPGSPSRASSPRLRPTIAGAW